MIEYEITCKDELLPENFASEKDFQDSVIKECESDIWYFLKYIFKVRVLSYDLDKRYDNIKFNIGHVAFINSFINDKPITYLCNPRQTCNTIILIALYLYIKYIKGCKTNIIKFGNILPDYIIKKYRKLLYDCDSILPDYIRNNIPPKSNIDYILINDFEYNDYEIMWEDIILLKYKTKRIFMTSVINDNISKNKLNVINSMNKVSTDDISNVEMPYILIPENKIFSLEKLKQIKTALGDDEVYRREIERRRK